jgi:CO/xanthine dehydrogenase FAD-binding subunit
MMTDLEGDELIEAITFRRSARSGSTYEKHSNVKGGWSTVGVGATVTLSKSGDRIDEVSVALAAVSDTPIRAPSVEEFLGESAISKEMIARAAAAVENDIDPLDDVSGSARYKQRLAETLTRRALTSAVERAGGERL